MKENRIRRGLGRPGCFEPLPPPSQSATSAPNAPVAQLDRALPSEGKGHTFESCRVRHSRTMSPVPVACVLWQCGFVETDVADEVARVNSARATLDDQAT